MFVCSSEQEDDYRTCPSGLVPRSFNLSADACHPIMGSPPTSPTDAAGVVAAAAPGTGGGTAVTASAATHIQTGGPVLCLDCNGNRAVVGGLDTNVQLHDLGTRDGGGAGASLLLSGHAGAVTSVALCDAASCKFAVSGSLTRRCACGCYLSTAASRRIFALAPQTGAADRATRWSQSRLAAWCVPSFGFLFCGREQIARELCNLDSLSLPPPSLW